MSERVGQRLGNYRLTRLLGSGGFADVYLGKHIYLDERQAAIKIIHAQLPNESKKQFYGEARLLTRLEHPRIVRLLDFAIEGDTPFLVMDYAPNGTLRQRYPKGTKLSLSTIIPHISQIAEALHYIHHQHQLVHRDIKPENLFLGSHQDVLLGDFGITVLSRSARIESFEEQAGTASYMAPEQIRSKSRRASDQYALGVIVYEWLCGEVPFRGSFYEVINQHLYAEPLSLQEKGVALPHSVEQVVMRALAKKPEDRFSGVLEFAQALKTAWEHVDKIASEPTVRCEPVSKRTKEQWVKKGITHYSMKQCREAIIAFTSAIELDPADALLYAFRGRAYDSLEDYPQAIKDFDYALKLDPKLIWVQFDREQAYRQLKKKAAK